MITRETVFLESPSTDAISLIVTDFFAMKLNLAKHIDALSLSTGANAPKRNFHFEPIDTSMRTEYKYIIANEIIYETYFRKKSEI